MLGAFVFGAPYFGDAINIDHGAAEPHVLSAFGRYEPFVSAFGKYEAQLDTFGRFDAVLDTFSNEGEV